MSEFVHKNQKLEPLYETPPLTQTNCVWTGVKSAFYHKLNPGHLRRLLIQPNVICDIYML